MGRFSVGRMLLTTSVVSTKVAVRASVGGAGVAADRLPRLALLAVSGTLLGERTAPAAFRDELLGMFRDGAESASRQWRRGFEDLDEATRPALPAGPMRRPHRVKP